jgi:hypothetical protein
MHYIPSLLAFLAALTQTDGDPVPTSTSALSALESQPAAFAQPGTAPASLSSSTNTAWIIGGAATVAGIILLASNDGDGGNSQPVPEPVSCVTLAAGAASLAYRRRRLAARG